MIEYVAAACSLTGCAGVYRKVWWGPFIAAFACTAWCGIAISTGQYPWASVECAYALISFATALKWSR